MQSQKYSVTMFAYNEEKNIAKSISSVLETSDDRLDVLHVIANGCSDGTAEVVRALSATYPKVRLTELAIGDKCNAWNHYVHNMAQEQGVHFFVDADVTFVEDSFSKMFDKLMVSDGAMAIAGLPFSGRNMAFYRSLVIDGVCLFGNCYGVKHAFIELARVKKFYLPLGLSWIDSVITKAINCDITNQYDDIPDRIVHHLEAGYQFDRLKLYKWSDLKLYLGRLARYQVGKLQEVELNKLEFYQYPRVLDEINQQVLQKLNNKEVSVPWYLLPGIKRRLTKDFSRLVEGMA